MNDNKSSMNQTLMIELIIKPFLTFLRLTIKNSDRVAKFDKYFIEARNLLLQWYPIDEFPERKRRSKT